MTKTGKKSRKTYNPKTLGKFIAPKKSKRKNGGGGRGGGMRTNATNVLTQGVGAVTNAAFGSRDGVSLACWDATMPMHLPLPRAIGPYLVMRTTRRFSSNSRCQIFGTFKRNIAAGVWWSSVCAVHDYDAAAPINATSNAAVKTMPMSELGGATTLVPSALTVQVMNPEALNGSSGMVYAGVMHTQAAVCGRTDKWDDYFDKFIEFQAPRMLSAGKLVLRGVRANAYPLNMNALSEFTPLSQEVDGNKTWDYSSYGMKPEGFCPIMVYNTGPDPPALEYLVTIEWRVRFDLDHPASSAHRHHPVATDHTWNNLMAKAAAFGNGVVDIADVVANVGKAVVDSKALPFLAGLL